MSDFDNTECELLYELTGDPAYLECIEDESLEELDAQVDELEDELEYIPQAKTKVPDYPLPKNSGRRKKKHNPYLRGIERDTRNLNKPDYTILNTVLLIINMIVWMAVLL